MNERLQRLIARREARATEREQLAASRKAITDIAEEEAREDLSPEEDGEFREITEKIKRADVEISDYDARIRELSEEQERSANLTAGAEAVRRAKARASVVSEARTYEHGNGNSYIRDLVRVQTQMDHGQSGERLRRHAIDVQTDPEYRAALDRTDGTGGYFVPPLWMMNQYLDLARAGRATANAVGTEALPPNTDSLMIPRIATGTSTAVQTADNAAVSETSLTDAAVTVPVRTVAGEQNIALQLLDQSPVNFDQIVFRDLVASHAATLDNQVLNGSGSNGQATGIHGTSGIQTIALTGTTVADLYSAIADAVQRVQTSRFMQPTVIVMHPRRWASLTASMDTTGRPLIVPSAGQGPTNALATSIGPASEQVVGNIHGLPVVTDPNISTNNGTGTDEDLIYVMRASDLLLMESGIRTRVLPEVGSHTLTVRLQVYSYFAFSAARYPKSVVEIGGAGLVAPTF